MNTRLILASLLALTLLAPAPARARTVVVDGTDIAHLNASASVAGAIVAMERIRFKDGPGLCADVLSSDILVYESRAACGTRVERLVTHDGRSSDPAVSADGSRVAWRTLDVDGVTTRIFVADPDGVQVDEVHACAGGEASDLDIAADGSHVVFRAWDCSGSGVEEIRRVSTTSPYAVDIVDTMPAKGSLGLNRHRTMMPDDTVLYSKRVGLGHDLFKRGLGSPAPLPAAPPTPEDERNVSVDSVAGHSCVFRRTSLSGVDNLFALAITGFELQLTTNTSSAWRIGPSTVSDGGFLYTFESNGDFAGSNADGSHEVFAGIFSWTFSNPPLQVTDVPAPPPPPVGAPILHAIIGSTIVDAGPVSAYSYRGFSAFVSAVIVRLMAPCQAVDLNRLTLTEYPRRYGNLDQVQYAARSTDPLIPSYEATLALVGTGCQRIGASDEDAECTVALVNSDEGARRVLVFSDWNKAGCQRQQQPPLEVDVPAGQTAKVTFRCVTGCSGTFVGDVLIDVVSPDAGQQDAVATLAWDFP